MFTMNDEEKAMLGSFGDMGKAPASVSGFVASLNKDMVKKEAGADGYGMFQKLTEALNSGADMQSVPIEERVSALMQELGEAELIDENGYPDYGKSEEANNLINNALNRWSVTEDDITKVKKQQQAMNYLSRT